MALKQFPLDIDLMKNQLLQARFQNISGQPAGVLGGQFWFDTATSKFMGWNGTAAIDLSQVITNTTTVKGEIANANTNPPYPTSPVVGDYYFITTTAGNIGGIPGTAGSVSVEVGDQLVYSTSGFFVIQRNLQAATNAVAGFIKLATQAEAFAGSDAVTSISPATLAQYLANYLYTKKFRMVITSLVANTPTTVTHGLAVVNITDIQVTCYQNGSEIELAIVPTTVNAFTVEANQTLGNVTIVVQG